ncbi:hypothetical protein PCANB_001471 [Pneumocystis canis]|nr:hypothetical protein PCANB_001471 [Pneumocystis canis]
MLSKLNFLTRLNKQQGISTSLIQDDKILAIAKLTRQAEEAKHKDKIESKSFLMNSDKKNDFFKRLKQKSSNISAEPLEQGSLPYEKSKMIYFTKNLSLKNSLKSLIQNSVKNISFKSKTENKMIKKPMGEMFEKYVNYEECDIPLQTQLKKISGKSLKIKNIETKKGSKFNPNEYKIDDTDEKAFFEFTMEQKYAHRMPIPWKPQPVSQEDLKPYMPTWIAPSDNLIDTFKYKNSLTINKKQKEIDMEFELGKLDDWNTTNMNHLNFYANQYIYKNPSIRLDQKIEMINAINKIVKYNVSS